MWPNVAFFIDNIVFDIFNFIFRPSLSVLRNSFTIHILAIPQEVCDKFWLLNHIVLNMYSRILVDQWIGEKNISKIENCPDFLIVCFERWHILSTHLSQTLFSIFYKHTVKNLLISRFLQKKRLRKWERSEND